MNNEIIESDFEVSLDGEYDEGNIFIERKGLLYHIVIHANMGGYYEIDQCHVHAFELASLFINCTMPEYSLVSEPYKLSNGYDVNFKHNTSGYEVGFSFDRGESYFPLFKSKDNIASFMKDVKLIKKIKEDITKGDVNQKNVIADLKDKDVKLDTVGYKFSENELTCLRFENLFCEDSEFRVNGVRDMYSNIINGNLVLEELIEFDSLTDKLNYVALNKECDCGSEGCFFDILKKQSIYFFEKRDILTDDSADEDKVLIVLKDIWKELSDKQKSLMLYLGDEFMNTPLLNLSFCQVDLDVKEYIRLMTFPYQPDSHDEQDLREVCTIVSWFAKMT